MKDNSQAESQQLRALSILLVEDNLADIHWLRLMLDERDFRYRLVVATNGEEAIEYLGSTAHPDLLLLDINLPRVSGIEVLQAIRMNEAASRIPVCVLTGSELERELMIAKYRLDVRCYIVKPITAEGFGGALCTYDILKPWAAAWEERRRITDRRA